MKLRLFILAAVFALYMVTSCAQRAWAHGTHMESTGSVIGQCYVGPNEIWHKIGHPTKRQDDNHMYPACLELRRVLWVIDHPEHEDAIHLLEVRPCSDWPAVCSE